MTRLDEDALSFASPQVKTFTHPAKEKRKRQSQTAGKVKLVLTRPPPGALVNPRWHLPTAGPGGDGSRECLPVGCDEAGLPLAAAGLGHPKCVSRRGQAKRAGDQALWLMGTIGGLLKYSE